MAPLDKMLLVGQNMESLTLHEYHSSGNCYKIRLTAALLGILIHKLIQYDVNKGETRTQEYTTKVNRNGCVPVLQVGKDVFIPESGAACYYLATGSHLIPSDRLEHAQMLQWMFFEQYDVEPNIAVLRRWIMMIGKDNLTPLQTSLLSDKQAGSKAALDVMNGHLSGRTYFVGEKFTLADVVCYGYTHLAGDAGFDMKEWPNIRKWCERIEAEQGYVSIDHW